MKSNILTTRRAVRFILPLIAVFAIVFAAYALLPSSTEAQQRRASITVRNNSDWTIRNLYVSPSSENAWGPDQLGQEVIESGGSFTLRNIPCDEYDIKLVDSDGDECVVNQVDLCNDNSTWTITNQLLASCARDGE